MPSTFTDTTKDKMEFVEDAMHLIPWKVHQCIFTWLLGEKGVV